MVALIQSSSNLVALPPASSQKQKIKSFQSLWKPIENQDLPLLPLEISDIDQILESIDRLGQKEQPGSEKTDFRKNTLSLKDQGVLKNKVESSCGLGGITAIVEDIHLPQLFNALNGIDQSKGPEVIKAKGTIVIQ